MPDIVTRSEARFVVDFFDMASDYAWPAIKTGLADRGYKPEEIIRIWKKLERRAGLNGTAPQPEDF